jgi:hypothetical protein
VKKLIIATVFFFWHSLSPAHAYESQIEPTRFLQVWCTNANFNQHWNHVAVPVYVSINPTYGVQLLKKNSTTNWTAAEFAEQLKIAIAEFNLNAGPLLRLYYAGTITTTSASAGISIYLSNTPSNAVGFAGATNWSCVPPDRGRILKARVVINRYGSTGADRYFSGWDYSAGLGDSDLHAIFTHEVGHAIGLEHTTIADLRDSSGQSYTADVHTVMNPSVQPNTRHWTKYEKDSLRYLYSPNTGSLEFYQSGPSRGYGTSWKVVATTPPAASMVSGLGKMTETAETMLYGWEDPFDPRVKGRSRTNHGVFTSFVGPDTPPVNMPPAMTASTQTATAPAEYRAYWLERGPVVSLPPPALPGTTAAYGPGFVYKKIYWMKSSDGINWTPMGHLVNPANSQPIQTWTDSITASYDPYRRVFAVLWIDDMYNGRIFTMPGPQSPQTSNVYSPLFTTFWEAPSLACLNTEQGFQPGCMIVGMQHAVSAPLVVLTGQITATGTWSTSLLQQYTNIPQTQTPSVWASWDGQFLLGTLERGNDSIAIYRRLLNGSVWNPVLNVIRGFSSMSPPMIGGSYSSGWSHAIAGSVVYGPQ